ncbi:unnamed protein product [Cochlearia groenlandica]
MVLLHHRLRLHHRISIATPADSHHHRRTNLHGVVLRMRFGLTRDLPLKRYFANYPITSGSRRQLSNSPVSMAAKNDNFVKTSSEETSKEGEEKDKKKKKEEEVLLPPPPEKPEAGDCCGSGCVRCVWDVYYDDLEDYNKLCSSVSGETKSN